MAKRERGETERDSRNEIANNGEEGERVRVEGDTCMHASGRGEGCLNRVREIQCTSKAVCNPVVQDVNVKGTPANIKRTVS